MKNKRRNFAIFVLIIISILVIFLSLIIVNEIKNNTNDKETSETGLVLLDTGYEENELVNSLEEIDYPEDSGLMKFSSGSSKSSSKKSEKSKNSGDNLISEKISASNEEEIVKSVDSGGDVKVAKEAKITENISKSAQVEKDIIDYSILSFKDLPPIVVCDKEKIEKIALDLGKIKLSFGFLDFSCATSLTMGGQANIRIKYCLMEDDVVGDDEIQCIDAYATTYDCETLDLGYLNNQKQERIFKNVDFSGFFGGVEGDTIEVYAKLLSPDSDFDTYVTTTYDINLDKGCQCFSGECCSLSTRRFKGYGSQPTGKEDAYFCSGTNSATSINYVDLVDWLCNGNSIDSFIDRNHVDTCGVCKYCENGKSKCGNYDSSISCGTGKHCDGSGGCVACQTHSNSKCSDNDVYWFDECGNVEDKKTECGTDSCGTWENYCSGKDLYKKRTCYSRGCLNNACLTDTDTESQKVQSCQYGCEDGRCLSHECDKDSDCGGSGYSGNSFCSDGDIYRLYKSNYCVKSGQVSYCSNSETNQKIKDCGTDEYSGDRYCYDNNIYQDKIIKGCSNAQCTNSTGNERIKDCGANGCLNEQCKDDIGKPDLIIKDAFVYYISDKTVFLRFIIENAGKGTAKNVYWMIDTDSFDKNPSRTNSITLQEGNFTRAYMTWTYSEKKNYNPTIIVDPNNYVDESNEDNNRESVSATLVWYPV